MKNYAIIEAGSEQLQVETGRFYDVRHLVSKMSSKITNFEMIDIRLVLYRILMIRSSSDTIIGTPFIKDGFIKGRILRFYKNQKIVVYKMQPKKKTRKHFGYRQSLNRFVVDGIYIDRNKLSILD